ncbi:MAG: HDIG domain-containing protein [Clostridia bacterium]|nr:HDIG domain-containing protein [Clostridia bacterium]
MKLPGNLDENKEKFVRSALFFVLGYFITILAVFLMIVVYDPSSWQSYIAENFSNIISLIVSIFFLFSVVFAYYTFVDPLFLLKGRKIALVFALIIVSVLTCFAVGHFIHFYARPLAMFAFLSLFLLGRKHTLFLNFVFAFLMFVIDLFTNTVPATEINSEIYSSFLLCFVSGTFAVFLAGSAKTRGSLLLSGIFISLPTVIVILLFNLPQAAENWIVYVSDAGSRMMGCITAAILALALLPVFEGLFNELTVFRLRELTSTNAALLVRLKKEAPGTFNHSLIVAQLAESCAVAIGENSELARAAAYYHDVGKLKQPECFMENQTDYNIHDEITPELSADIIRSHAKDGYELLMQGRLPKEIANVAREHHGTLPIKYFYDKAMRYSGDADIKDFSYLGPVPHSKIAAIVMISDAAEAAVRAAADRSPETVESICRYIIEERMDLGQFDECNITLKELTVIKYALVEALSGVHHHRVQYPAIRFNRDHQAVSLSEERDV